MRTQSRNHPLVFIFIFGLLSLRHAVAADPPHILPNTKPNSAALQIPRIDRAPHLEEFLAMRPSPEWEGKLAVVQGFIQRAPDDGEAATQPTEAYLGYDSHALHIIFVAHDSEPNRIRARLDHRESIASDEDQVGIY